MKFDINSREDIAVHEDWKAERGLNVYEGNMCPDVEAMELIEGGDRSGFGNGDGFGVGYGNGNGDGYGHLRGSWLGDGHGDGSGYGFGIREQMRIRERQ